MKTKLTLFLMLCFVIASHAQTSQESFNTMLRGTIFTKFGASPDSAQVELDTAKVSNQYVRIYNIQEKWWDDSYTNSQGEYQFVGLKPGKYLLFVEDPTVKKPKPIYVDLFFSKSGKAKLKPLTVDRTQSLLSVKE